MKHKLSTTLALVVLTMAIAASGARSQTVANGPYYAPPAWDQTLPSSTRFIVLSNMNNEAVLDRETGLVWQRTVLANPQSFSSARQLCHFATTGNRGGWRLPSFHELRSLIDPSVIVPLPNHVLSLPAGHPFIIGPAASSVYWTGTSVAEGPDSVAYATGLSAPLGLAQFFKTSSLPFWCVRGGGPISIY